MPEWIWPGPPCGSRNAYLRWCDANLPQSKFFLSRHAFESWRLQRDSHFGNILVSVNVKKWELSVNLSVASCGASFAIQGQCETWSCNREFESFSSIDCLNGKAGSKIRTNGWGRREKLTDTFSWESQVFSWRTQLFKNTVSKDHISPIRKKHFFSRKKVSYLVLGPNNFWPKQIVCLKMRVFSPFLTQIVSGNFC